MQIVVNGIMTNYEQAGRGPVVLLLHGWGDSLQTFNSLTSALQGNYTVLRLDLPGFGKTATPEEVFNLDKFADFIEGFLGKLDIKNLCAVVGHSNGGAIAIKSVANKQVNPQELVLLASSGLRTPYSARNKGLRMLAKMAKVPTTLLPKKTQESLKKKAYSAIGSEAFVAENMQETFKNIVGEDVLELAEQIRQPALLIYGENDTATPPEYGQKFAKAIKDSRLEIIPGVGHFVHLDSAEQVSKLVQEFLA